jgi:signal transduction histidine kinase
LKVERVRNNIAADLHDDVASTVSSISYYSEFAKSKVSDDNAPLINILDQIGENARESLETMRDVIWSSQSKFDSLVSLKQKISSYANSYCISKNIELTWIDSGFDTNSFLPPDLRRNLYLIGKESIHNAVKHAQCTAIKVELTLNKKQIKLIIQDNGKGFDIEKETHGNGLNNIAHRAKESSSQLKINSNIGIGTSVELISNIP